MSAEALAVKVEDVEEEEAMGMTITRIVTTLLQHRPAQF